MTSFYSNEENSLEKVVVSNHPLIETKADDIDEVYEIKRCAEWIQSNGFKKVCLQFPDYLLQDASEVVLKLESIVNETIYLLGDTVYESCCIDFIAAAHINADAIIHFGPVCFSKFAENVPFMYVYEKRPLDIAHLKKIVETNFDDYHVAFLVDFGYLHLFDKLVEAFKDYKYLEFIRIDNLKDVRQGHTIFFYGKDERKMFNITSLITPLAVFYYDIGKSRVQAFADDIKSLTKRRYYLIERIKDSDTIGIIVGSIGIQNCLKLIDRLKSLISRSGKKYYLLNIGKPAVEKLANFPEFDVYVVIACSMSEIYDRRDFYKPIATPFDVETALNVDLETNPEWIHKFSYDFNDYLDICGDISTTYKQTEDISLLTNKVRVLNPEVAENNNGDQTIAVKNDGTIALGNSGAGYLAQRTWKGLEQNLGQTEVELAKEGRAGIASKYENEQS
ncbi:2-(3-amino-3-carboxypropyl)histidine synthase subunit 2 [Diabrotica virgifera virgifera]|uniref:2-(3-amino-3-carboxypropyl)histidine synthase subunit 2 n=1 Tax=Diabrotica virgifera virgifera TaxID=50390 RepID=A0A6P7F2F7_DIAVI|nr:2-(3-amino-3-carboxypropyl)histidine synthase subunit 2 [Diabrotica virgifera virgifera]